MLKNKTPEDIFYDPEIFIEPIHLIGHPRLISIYQGHLYEEIGILTDNGTINLKALGDYFAEGYREFIQNPKNLKEKDRLLYEFIKERLK